MAVNLEAPRARDLLPVAGVRLGVTEAGIRKAARKDLLVIALDEGAHVAGVFTRNRLCAAPVVIARQHLSMIDPGTSVRALVVNTGNANAGTGAKGLADARAVCQALSRLGGYAPSQVLPFSTGVIMEPLPVERIEAGLPACLARLAADAWLEAAEAIMTTDTIPKAASERVRIGGSEVTLTGIAKGSGMIRPDMATMLGFVATDARLSEPLVRAALARATKCSFNRITVDGDTSTNDSFMLIATGRAAMPEIADERSAEFDAFCEALARVSVRLAQAIVRDGEGATKFITLTVEGGGTEEECTRVAYAVAHSPLVKTAFFASDPNLGRILAAIGYSGIADLDLERVDLWLDEVHVATRGARSQGYREEDGARVMAKPEIAVRIALGRGSHATTVWTCDLSHDYVRINAEYRT